MFVDEPFPDVERIAELFASLPGDAREPIRRRLRGVAFTIRDEGAFGYASRL